MANVKKNIIGVDDGNSYGFVCVIENIDEKTRTGGIVRDLIPDKYRGIGTFGIPNEFFWNGGEELWGFSAVNESLRPAENHLRLLKRNIKNSITLYSEDKTKSKTFKYSDLITKSFSYIVTTANEALREAYGESGTTNLISIAYPASLSDPASLRYFISLAEAGDSGAFDEKGNMLKIKVVGAVCESAAAGLDRLAKQMDNVKSDTVTYGVFDLGGGTFDISIVSLYPKGKKASNNKVYYYDLVVNGEGLNIGGGDFTKALGDIFREKLTKEIGTKKKLPISAERKIIRESERAKLELTSGTRSVMSFEINDDYYDIEVTREEFEARIKSDIDKIINYTTDFFNTYSKQAPDEIIITGGSSNLPCIIKRLNEALPKYVGKIHLHEPSRAASYGAARFYDSDMFAEAIKGGSTIKGNGPITPTPGTPTPVLKTVQRDIGTIVVENGVRRMDTLIAAGTLLPCDSGVQNYSTNNANQSRMDYDIYMAKGLKPVDTAIGTDYEVMHQADLDFGKPVPKGTSTSCQVSIDSLGQIVLKAWQKNNDKINIKHDFKLKDNE